MAWVYLFTAALFEIVWAIGLKYTDGLTKPGPTAITLSAMAVSVLLLAQAARTLPIGTSYAVWTGVGTVGTAVFGILLFSEPVTATRLLFLLLIVSGIAGLKWSG